MNEKQSKTVDTTYKWESVAKFIAEAYVEQDFQKGDFAPMISLLEVLQHLQLDKNAYQRVGAYLQQRSYTQYRNSVLGND